MAEEITNITNRGQITNPYDKEHRAEYKMGSVEAFLHDKLGFRTGYDTYHENMDNASAAWLAQQENNVYEEQYNSAEAQAQRMREAGLNPDIAPGSIAPGEATEFTEPESMPQAPEGQDMEAVIKAGTAGANLAMFIVDMVSGGISIATAMRGLKNLKLEGENTEIAGSQEMFEAVQKAHEIYGNLKQGKEEQGLTFASGRYVGKAMGYTGRRLADFARMYDDTYNSIPVITKNKGNLNTLSRTQWESDNMQKILNAEEMGIEATAARLLVETTRNKQIAEVLEKYPEFTKEGLLAGNARAIAEAAAAGDEAKIKHYEAKAEKAIQEVNEINARADKEASEQDNEIILKFYDEMKTTPLDAAIPIYGAIRKYTVRRRYERATRRRYGRNTDVQDNKIRVPRIKGKL